MSTESSAKLGEVLQALREDAGLGGEDDTRWVRIQVGPIPIFYPNSRGRRRVLAAHDLHHVLARYGTDLLGEGEMAAWELGSGLRDRSHIHYALRVFGFVVPWRWKRLRTAFARGRRCRNLGDRTLDAEALARTVAETRAELGLDEPAPDAGPEDRRAFRRWALKGIAIVWGPLLPIGLALWWWLG